MSSETKTWARFDASGFTREDLLEVYEQTRSQRNNHRQTIFDTLRLNVTILSGILAAESAIAFFGIRSLIEADGDTTFGLFSLGLIATLILATAIAVAVLRRRMTQLTRIEYRKVLEYLTVEQKIEHLLGIRGTLPVAFPFESAELPYRGDRALAHERWVKGSDAHLSSEGFTESIMQRETVFFAPLLKIISWIFWMNVFLSIFALGAFGIFVLQALS